ISRLPELPDFNPAGLLVKGFYTHNQKTHRSLLHQELAHPNSICKSLACLPGTINPVFVGLQVNNCINRTIASSKEEAKNFTLHNLADPPADTVKLPHPKKTSRTSSSHSQFGSTLCILSPLPDKQSPYLAELVGLDLSVSNARKKAPPNRKYLWFFTYNQYVIRWVLHRNITKTLNLQPGCATCLRFQKHFSQLLTTFSDAKVSII
ncbi:hypothetical protein DFH28DRAFT_893071, partial [Melampsora americana]